MDATVARVTLCLVGVSLLVVPANGIKCYKCDYAHFSSSGSSELTTYVNQLATEGNTGLEDCRDFSSTTATCDSNALCNVFKWDVEVTFGDSSDYGSGKMKLVGASRGCSTKTSTDDCEKEYETFMDSFTTTYQAMGGTTVNKDPISSCCSENECNVGSLAWGGHTLLLCAVLIVSVAL